MKNKKLAKWSVRNLMIVLSLLCFAIAIIIGDFSTFGSNAYSVKFSLAGLVIIIFLAGID